MSTENIIARALQIVGVLFSAVGGFLVGIAPPDRLMSNGSPRFSVGIATFAGAVLLLIISALTETRKRQKRRKFWLITGSGLLLVFLASSIRYPSKFDELTFLYPEGVAQKTRFVNGTNLTDAAMGAVRQFEQQHGYPPSKARLVAGFEGVEHLGRVWVESSIRTAERSLLISYLVIVLSLMGAVFAVVEGTLRTTEK